MDECRRRNAVILLRSAECRNAMCRQQQAEFRSIDNDIRG
jgi:hypothetical protein